MIEGFHIDVPGTKLKEVLEARAKYYQGVFNRRQETLLKLEEDDRAELDTARDTFAKTSNSAADGMRDKVRATKNRLEYFKFTSQFIVTTETYRLSQKDLESIEIVTSRY